MFSASLAFLRRRCFFPSLTTGNFSTTISYVPDLPYRGKDDLGRIRELEKMVAEAWLPSARTSRQQHPTKRVDRLNADGNLYCYKCKMFHDLDSFYVDARTKYQRGNWCRSCMSDYKMYYPTFTLRGALNVILSNAKWSAKKRSIQPGREEAGRYELDLHLLLNIWLQQRGRCAYSGLVMSMEPYTAWRFSLERRNNTCGYVPGNVVFVCSEFNASDHTAVAKRGVVGSVQWSWNKVHSLPNVISASQEMSGTEIDNLIAMKTSRKNHCRTRIIAPSGDLYCSKCIQYKRTHEFYASPKGLAGRSSVCVVCSAQYLWSFRGFFMSRLDIAKLNANRRLEKGRCEAGVCDLSLQDIYMLYKRQQGLCFYSGIRVVLKPLSEWMCSIERLDNTKGYTVENIVLICHEFQTPDRSYAAKGVVKGSSQWSKEKVDMLVEWLKPSKEP